MKHGVARFIHHLRHDARTVRRLFPDAELTRFEASIERSERMHAAEIRVAIEASLPTGRLARGLTPRERALEVFALLHVWDTAANNGILLYVLLADHAIEIVADRAAAAALGDALLQQACAAMQQAFARGEHVQGLDDALALLEPRLIEAFPLMAGQRDPDELPNRPTLL